MGAAACVSGSCGSLVKARKRGDCLVLHVRLSSDLCWVKAASVMAAWPGPALAIRTLLCPWVPATCLFPVMFSVDVFVNFPYQIGRFPSAREEGVGGPGQLPVGLSLQRQSQHVSDLLQMGSRPS